MKTVPSKKFNKSAKKLQRSTANALKIGLKIFEEDPFNPILNNHALRGSMRGYRSIDITGDYRLIYEPMGDDVARIIDIGTHGNLYGK